MNHIVIAGRVVDDPEIRETPKKIPVSSFMLASIPPPPGRTIYLKCVAWNQLAVRVAALRKNTRVVITGYLSSTKWVDRAGSIHNRLELVIENLGVTQSSENPGFSHSKRRQKTSL